MDRLGSGQSDHPLDLTVSLTSGAYVTHELVNDLKSGKFGNTTFQKVVLVGHSAGSGIAILEASTFQDVSGIILSGYAHILNPLAAPLIATDFYPAFLYPKFTYSLLAGQGGYSAGYMTTKLGVRGSLFL